MARCASTRSSRPSSRANERAGSAASHNPVSSVAHVTNGFSASFMELLQRRYESPHENVRSPSSMHAKKRTGNRQRRFGGPGDDGGPSRPPAIRGGRDGDRGDKR